MKKFFLFFIAITILSISFYSYFNTEQIWEKKVFSYLNNTYVGKFELVNTNKDKNKYTFLFCTDDDNRIQFEVKCWIGGYDTPWGTIYFIPKRHFVDNFSDQIVENTNSAEVYDMSGKTMSEVVQFVKINSKKRFETIQNIYKLYKIPKYKGTNGSYINIKYNDKIEQIPCYTDDGVVQDFLLEKFY